MVSWPGTTEFQKIGYSDNPQDIKTVVNLMLMPKYTSANPINSCCQTWAVKALWVKAYFSIKKNNLS